MEKNALTGASNVFVLPTDNAVFGHRRQTRPFGRPTKKTINYDRIVAP